MILKITKLYKKFKDKSSLDAIEIKNNTLVILFHPNKIFVFKKNEEKNLYIKDDTITKQVVEKKAHKIRK